MSEGEKQDALHRLVPLWEHLFPAEQARIVRSLVERVPLAIRHKSGRKTIVTPMTNGVAPVTTRADPALVKALARAFRYQRMLDDGR